MPMLPIYHPHGLHINRERTNYLAPKPAELQPAESPLPCSPPAKRTRKRRGEVKLLRDGEEESSLLSPLSCQTPSPSLTSITPSRSPQTVMLAQMPVSPTPLPGALPSVYPTTTDTNASDAPGSIGCCTAGAWRAPLPLMSLVPPQAPAAAPTQPWALALPAPSGLHLQSTEPAPPSPPHPRIQHQQGWDLCHECRKHYHQKSYLFCCVCNLK